MKKHTHDLIIIGGGSGGLTVAAGASQLGLKTALIEKEHMGGDCLYFGCVPSKTLIHSAAVYAGRHGTAGSLSSHPAPAPPLDLPDAGPLMRRVRDVINEIKPHDSPERFRNLGVDVRLDSAEFIDLHTLKLSGGDVLSAPKFVISTGSSPFIPPIPGLKESGYITNREIFTLEAIPRRLLVIGGGPIGVEMSQTFARFGTEVTMVDQAPHVLSREDADMASIVQQALKTDGVRLFLNSTVVSVEQGGINKLVTIQGSDGSTQKIEAEEILVASGRRGNMEGLGLDVAGVETSGSYIQVDESLRTSQKHIYACGDVNGRYLFTHTAGAEGSVLIRRLVFHLPAKMDYRRIPWSTYSDPELASAGLNEKRASELGIPVKVLRTSFRENDRARAENAEEGVIKILLDKKDRIIGSQIAAVHAGELITPAILAIQEKWKIGKLLSPIFPYPTLSEIYRKAAGDYLSPRLFNGRTRKILRTLFHYRG